MGSTNSHIFLIAACSIVMEGFTLAHGMGVPPARSPTSHAIYMTDAQFITPFTSAAANDSFGDLVNTFNGLHWWWKALIFFLVSSLITWSCSCCKNLIINYYYTTSRQEQTQNLERQNERQNTQEGQTNDRQNEAEDVIEMFSMVNEQQNTQDGQTDERLNETEEAIEMSWMEIEMSSMV